MNDIILDYLAKKVWEDLRSAQTLDVDLAAELNIQPIIDKLRKHVVPKDEPLLRRLIDSGDPVLFYFGISLLRTLGNQPHVRALFVSLWEKHPGYEFRMPLMWRLLDYEDLELEVHEELYEFVRKNWDEWSDFCLNWYVQGNLDKLAATLEKRIGEFTSSKAWTRIIMAEFIPDHAAARRLVAPYVEAVHPVVRKVANEMMEKVQA